MAEKVYRDLGADVTVIGNRPNGLNINEGFGSTHPGQLKKKVIEEKALMGLAFDGDADRLIAVDEKGNIIDGDRQICICAKMMKQEGTLKDNKVTATVMSNIGFHKYMEDLGCAVNITKVGDRYVLEEMVKSGCVIGGEQSGHIIFLDHTTTGDGILSSLQLIKAVKESGLAPSELFGEVAIDPQVLRNAKVKNENKNKYEKDPEILREIKRLEEEMEGEGRILIRPSGTEPLVRVMIEGRNEEYITDLAEDLAELITRKLGQ